MIDASIWDDPFAYDGTYNNAAQWGERRWATPGVVVGGELLTTNLHHLNIGIEEFVEHSFYEGWKNEGIRHRTDRPATRCRPTTPGTRRLSRRPAYKRSWKERYTWDTAPRWGPPGDGVRRLRPDVDHGGRQEAAAHPLHGVGPARA